MQFEINLVILSFVCFNFLPLFASSSALSLHLMSSFCIPKVRANSNSGSVSCNAKYASQCHSMNAGQNIQLRSSRMRSTKLLCMTVAESDINKDINKELTIAVQSPKKAKSIKELLRQFIVTYFIPSGNLSPDYYTYARWRMIQRFIAATSNVFGTQALLLALGFKKSSIGVSAASIWVMKDALGKFSRIFWASKYGRKFDSDAKTWRFFSSILFAIGNALEIFTYIMPSFFLLIAAFANAMKQMAMVTYSSTRNTM